MGVTHYGTGRYKGATLVLLCASLACDERVRVEGGSTGPQRNEAVRGTTSSAEKPGGRAGRPLPSQVEKKGRSLRNTGVFRATGGILEYELRPSHAGTYVGTSFQTNRWGMRDRDYDLARPSGVFRIALLGSSYAMAPGVPEEQSFASLLENKLNVAAKLAGSKQRYEILNFGVAGYTLLQNLAVTEKKVLRFEPNAVLVAVETTELSRLTKHLLRVVSQRVPLSYPELDSILRAAGIVPGMAEVEVHVRIRDQLQTILGWHFKHMHQTLQKRGVLTLVAVLSTPNAGGQDRSRVDVLADMADEQGFLLLEADDVFRGQPRDTLLVSPNARQLSALAHRLISESLERELRNKVGERIGLAAERGQTSQPALPASRR